MEDARDLEGAPSVTANTRVAAITGIVLGILPMLSAIGLIVSLFALAGYRRAAVKPTLAVIGIVVSIFVLVGTLAYYLMQWISA